MITVLCYLALTQLTPAFSGWLLVLPAITDLAIVRAINKFSAKI